MRTTRLTVLALAAGLSSGGLARAQTATGQAATGQTATGPAAQPAEAGALTIARAGASPRRLSMAELRALPATELSLAFATEHGQEHATYRGVRLWTLLANAGAIDPERPRDHVRQSVIVTGRDGYTAMLALGEIDPAFEGKLVLLAWERDGAKLNAPHLRLAVPGDAHGGRSVRDVVRIEVQ